MVTIPLLQIANGYAATIPDAIIAAVAKSVHSLTVSDNLRRPLSTVCSDEQQPASESSGGQLTAKLYSR